MICGKLSIALAREFNPLKGECKRDGELIKLLLEPLPSRNPGAAGSESNDE
jgi:hypothetical protein